MKMIDPKEFVNGELVRLHIVPAPAKLGRARDTRWFAEQPGFGLRRYASGREVYIVQSRMGGRQRCITICDARLASLQTALDVAKRCIYQPPQLPNPADTRKRKRSAPMFRDFLEFYWHRVSPAWKPKTLRAENDYRRAYLANAFDKMGIDELDVEHVQKWMIDATRRGAPGAANRAFDRLRAMFNKAEEWGFREEGTNPCHHVAKNKRRKCERFLSEVEYGRLGASIARFGRRYPLQAIVVQLLIATGCRRDEIRCMTWQQVRGSRLRVLDGKTGPRTVQLCSGAQQLLECVKRGKADDYVFPCSTGQPVSLDLFWNHVRDDSNLRNVRLHDLRHSYASRAARLGLPLPVAKQLLGHTKIENTARYTHFDDTHLFEIADFISGLIDAAMLGREVGR